MNDPDVRDMAVRAITKIEAHMDDCSRYRQIQLNAWQAYRDEQALAHHEFREDLKKINWRMAMILGGLIVLSHGVDYVLKFFGH